ncbi:putative transferase [Arabidopsis thaliana]
MEGSVGLLLVLLTLAIIHIVQAQVQLGFISLDCGLPANETGKTGRIRENPEGYGELYETVRYFPEGIRNCYNLIVEKGRKYLIKASFVYGNYDGRNIAPVFDLYLGPNLWQEIDLRQVSGTQAEILHIPTSNSLQICLVNNGTTIPLISTLELRPLGNGSHITESGSLKLFIRRYLSKSESTLRYRKDIYDRTWVPLFMKEWTQISTDLEVKNDNKYVPPEDALKTAATPTNTSAPLKIEWTNSHNPRA